MRILFLALVLANVVAFIWFGWLSPPAQTLNQSTPLPNVQPLQLITELTPEEQQELGKSSAPPIAAPAIASTVAAPVSTTNAAASQTVAQSCDSYGPFPNTEAMRTGVTRLQQAGTSVMQRVVPGKVRMGYWVYLPPFSSRREADAAAKLLKGRGVKDIYVVTDEANRNAISLGVFSDRGGAVARQKRMQGLGYHPVLTERFRDSPRYWLDARGTQAQLPAANVFTDLGEGDVIIGRAACSSASP